MRKIEEWMIDAIKNGESTPARTFDAKRANTRVHHVIGRVEVQLHGHTIARIDGDRAEFNLCGWNTSTTRSRINALAREFGHPGIFNKAGEPFTGDYLTRVRVPTNGWF